jgi:hypothetical protein
MLWLCLTFDIYAVGNDSWEKADMEQEMGIGTDLD